MRCPAVSISSFDPRSRTRDRLQLDCAPVDRRRAGRRCCGFGRRGVVACRDDRGRPAPRARRWLGVRLSRDPVRAAAGRPHALEAAAAAHAESSAQPASAAALIERCWTRFAGTANPGGSALSWPSFAAMDEVRLQFTLPQPSITNFRANECAFWISTYEAAFTDTAFQPSL